MKLHAAMETARTAPAHPVTVSDTLSGREYTWDCPAECTTRPCPMVGRMQEADWFDYSHLPAGDYLAVPTLWSIDLTHLDGTPVPAAEEAA